MWRLAKFPTRAFQSALVLLLIALPACSPERKHNGRFCRMWKECEPEEFEREFDSVQQCTKLATLESKADRYHTTVNEGRSCAKAMRRYDRCYSRELTCDRFLPDAPTMKEIGAAEQWLEDVAVTCSEELDDIRAECE